jgi:hypothetical protein
MAKKIQLGHFFCVDDESLIHVKMPQVMNCSRILSRALLEQITKLKKGFVSYFIKVSMARSL